MSMKMDYYDCKLRLHGVVTNEVKKENIAAPEILILRRLHGDDALVEIKYAYTGRIDATQERKRLSDRYDSGLKKVDDTLSVARMFGEEFTPLVGSLKGIKRPQKLVKKSEMKAARKELAKDRAHAQDNNVHKLDEDDIDGEDEDINEDDIDDEDDAPAAKTPKEKAPAEAETKVPAAAARGGSTKRAGGVI